MYEIIIIIFCRLKSFCLISFDKVRYVIQKYQNITTATLCGRAGIASWLSWTRRTPVNADYTYKLLSTST